jgi:hypothetical protein
MSNLAYTRALGVWNPGVIRASELQDLDVKSVKAPNFAEGGTYAPSSPVIVGGAGMTITLVGINNAESLFVSGTFDVAVGTNAYFRGLTSFRTGSSTSVRDGATWTFNADSTTTFAAGSFLNVEGTVTFTGSFNADFIGVGSVQIADSLYTAPDSVTNLNGHLSVVQSAAFHDDLRLEGTTTAVGAIVLSGAGTIIERVVIGSNSDSTYSVSSADLVYVPEGGVSAPRTYYLDEVGATNGKKIRFHREDDHADRPITLKRAVDGSQICLLTWKNTGYIWTDVVRISGVWQRVGGQFGES